MTGRHFMTRQQLWEVLAGLTAWQVAEVPTRQGSPDAVKPCATGLSRSADVGRPTHAHPMPRIADPPIRLVPYNCPAHDG